MSKQSLSNVDGFEAARPPAAPKPYVGPDQSPAEFTIKAVISGIIFGIVFGAANAYLGLQAGLTISTSIPVAVMTVAAFRAFSKMGAQSSILEANLAQTIGSASSSVASGVIFTLPALFLWGLSPALIQMTLLAMCGGLLGVLFMIPLRRFLIVREHANLPYPEGTACAEVLVASEVGGAKASNVFWGLGIGAAFKAIFAWLQVLPSKATLVIPGLPKANVGLNMSSALFGVGFILGPRIGSIMVGGGLLSSLVIIPGIAIWYADATAPVFPEPTKLVANMASGEIWTRYVRYIGAGAVATAGLLTLIRSIPTMVESFRIGIKQIKNRLGGVNEGDEPRTDRDMSLLIVFGIVAAIVTLLAALPFIFRTLPNFPARALTAVLVTIFAFFFVTVASRIVGLVGVTSNPTSGMTIASLLGTASIFLLLGWTDLQGMAAALTVGCVVAIAASIAGDTSQDLKTGFLLGATPWKQQTGELIGVLTSAVFVCLTLILLNDAYGFGSQELAAPQATLMKVVIEGVLQNKLPWILVGIGAGIALLCEIVRIPSLPFAVGVYLPVSTMVPVFLGGMLRWVLCRKEPDDAEDSKREKGVLLGSGLVGGEGLMGVGVAGVIFLQKALERKPTATTQPGASSQPVVDTTLPFQIGTAWGSPGVLQLIALGVFGLLALAFVWRCRGNRNATA